MPYRRPRHDVPYRRSRPEVNTMMNAVSDVSQCPDFPFGAPRCKERGDQLLHCNPPRQRQERYASHRIAEPNSQQLFVQWMASGEQICCIPVNCHTCGMELKEHIFTKSGIPPAEQLLFLGSSELQSGQLLHCCLTSQGQLPEKLPVLSLVRSEPKISLRQVPVCLTSKTVALSDAVLQKYECLGRDPLYEALFGITRLVRSRDTGKLFAAKCVEKEPLRIRNMLGHLTNEAKIQSDHRHCNLIRLLWCWETESAVFMLLEHCERGSLANVLGRLGQTEGDFQAVGEDVAAPFFRQMLAGAEYLHNMSLVHRSLNTDDMYITEENTLKIGNFLWCVAVEPEQRLTQCCGSISEYWPPELWSNAGYNQSLDVWCLGCILYEMLVGHPPFFGSSQLELEQRVLGQRFGYPPWLRQESGFESRHIISSILKREPNHRPSCTALLNDLAGRPIA